MDNTLGLQCGSSIEEGRPQNQPPTDAKYCVKSRAARRRRANLKYVWRPEYDEYLKVHYYGGLNLRFQVLNRMIRNRMIRETGIPRWYIKKRAARLGLTMRQDKRPWTAAEEEIIERLVGKVSALTIAKRLKRTEASVVLKIKRMGVSRRVRNGHTMRDLEECFGEDHHKIERWIANGWLRDRLQGTRRHDDNGRDIHRLREKGILDFLVTLTVTLPFWKHNFARLTPLRSLSSTSAFLLLSESGSITLPRVQNGSINLPRVQTELER